MTSSKKVSLVAAAVAAALGSSAYALPPAAWTSGMPVFYAGGGSAEVQAVYVAVANQLVTSSINVYTDGTGSALHPQSLNYLVVSGTLKTGGTNVGFIYKYSGGSFTNGVQPFLPSAVPLSYPTLASLAGAVTNGATSPTSLNPDFVYTASNTNSQSPDWGISDEEGALFQYNWNANGVNTGAIGSSIGKPLYVAPFGVAVTANIYAQKKHFSKAEIAAIYQGTTNGNISTWSSLVADDGVTPLSVANDNINLLDRGSGSGSKAAANAYFLDYPSGNFKPAGKVLPFSVASDVGGSGPAVNNYTTACGRVLCLTGAATNGFQDVNEASSVSVVDDLVKAQNAGMGAIAVLGLEFPPVFEQTTPGTNDYFFVAINGVFPDSNTGNVDNLNNPVAAGTTTKYSNVINGSYDFAFQTGLQKKTGLTGFQANVLTFLGGQNISAAHTGTAFPAATSGVLLDPVTTGSTSAGNLSWTRNANSSAAPVYFGAVTPANGDPL